MGVADRLGELFQQSVSMLLEREEFDGHASFAWARAADFESIEAGLGEFLHVDEVERFRSLSAERRKFSYLMGRFTAKSALGKYMGSRFEKTTVPVTAGVFGQPVVEVGRPTGVSISHTDSLACSIAFPREHPMGVDIETVDGSRTETMMTQILPSEYELARSICDSEHLSATLVWTAKEALSKVLKCGMTCPYELFEISSLQRLGGQDIGRFRNFGQYKFHSWAQGDSVVTIVLPRRTVLKFEFPDLV